EFRHGRNAECVLVAAGAEHTTAGTSGVPVLPALLVVALRVSVAATEGRDPEIRRPGLRRGSSPAALQVGTHECLQLHSIQQHLNHWKSYARCRVRVQAGRSWASGLLSPGGSCLV